MNLWNFDLAQMRVSWKLRNFASRTGPAGDFFQHLIFPPAYLRRSEPWRDFILRSRLNCWMPLMLDRLLEFNRYWGFGITDVMKTFKAVGFPRTEKFARTIRNIFESKKGRDESLYEAYTDTELLYTLNLMVSYDRYQMILPYMTHLDQHFGGAWESVNIVDYGCGVSDIGILMGMLGANVTYVELDNKRARFVAWRYQVRGLPCQARLLRSAAEYANFKSNSVDLFIATEVFEHLRNPLVLLENIATSLRPDGILFDSLGGEFEREVAGDHLAEAIRIGNSQAFRTFYSDHFEHLVDTPEEGCRFMFVRK